MSVNNILVLSSFAFWFLLFVVTKILRHFLCLFFSHLISQFSRVLFWPQTLATDVLARAMWDRRQCMYKPISRFNTEQHDNNVLSSSLMTRRERLQTQSNDNVPRPMNIYWAIITEQEMQCVHGYKRLPVGLPVGLPVCLSVCLFSRNSARWVLIGNSLALILRLAMFDPTYTTHLVLYTLFKLVFLLRRAHNGDRIRKRELGKVTMRV